MAEPTIYEIVLRGRASDRLLRPLLDDFACDHSGDDTRLIGTIRDAAHLHGVVIHLTSVKTELISIAPLATVARPTVPVPAATPTATPTLTPASRRAPAQEERP